MSSEIPAPPATEGELYDRLLALRDECDLLTGSVDPTTATFLQAAAAQIEAARRRWLYL